MPRKDARRRAKYTPGVGQVRGDVYKKALGRATDAYTAGDYLETIALVKWTDG